MTGERGDPGEIRSLAVTAEDLVAAVETNRTTDRKAVLRVTPPFSGRMRARLHVVQSPESSGTAPPIHIDPESLLTAGVPPYPRPSDTEDAIRADPDEEYTVERHREYHADAVEAWRNAVRDGISDRVTLDTSGGRSVVEVRVLG